MQYRMRKLGLALINRILIILFVLFLIGYGTMAFAGDATLSWNSNTEPDLAGYKVYYGTASGSYGTPIDMGNQTTYIVTGLGSGTYYFTVTAYDTSGNESGFSSEVTKTFADTTPPVISGITSSNVTSTGAVITWTTNEAATSQVEYGTTTAYGSLSALNSTPVTSHSRTLSSLTSSTTYNYRVISKDAAGNTAISGNNTFATSAAPDTIPPAISSIATSNITSNSVAITWTTNELSDTQVQYGTTTAYGSSTPLNTSLVTAHIQGLTELLPSTTYNLRVLSRDAAGNLATSGNNTFTTASAPDTTQPVISGIIASNITSTGVVITWTTNEAATSQVEYGTTTAYGSTSALNSTPVTSHSRTLSGLAPSTTYNYRVKSTDAAGNVATSGNNTFTTSSIPDTTPPVISSITSSNITSSSAVITWTTNEAATSQVDYGTTTAYGSTSALNSTPVTSHSRTLSGLAPSTTYNYRVKSVDAAGNIATSGNNTFTTSTVPDTTAPVISGVTASNKTSNSASINWTTNEAATSQVDYGTTTAYGSLSALNSTLLTSHSTSLSGLEPSTTYNYRVRSVDTAGNIATSGNNTFTTSGLPDKTPPGQVRKFLGVGGKKQATLSWTNPSDSDFMGVRILYKTGSNPLNINDGVLLGDFTGQPNGDMTTTHTGLQDSVTYYYSAFSYDGQGNYQLTAAVTQATTDSPSGGSGIPPSGGSSGLGGSGISESGATAGGCGFIKDTTPSRVKQVDIAMFIIPFLLGLRLLFRRHRPYIRMGQTLS